ncbi:hypothetical protein [Leptolyngbya sp. FACHB-17]|uniref:hypothetical protein n=1 Tax=unclassified Leptolyngbya TaxID=2650499 RepID=UPI001680EA15|nr:hypothetical protein [Leptolyngbya sp. FACHB-17]MBD2078715.1 hypothetical protein [Leptolyngbya sp. FACHB-17]
MKSPTRGGFRGLARSVAIKDQFGISREYSELNGEYSELTREYLELDDEYSELTREYLELNDEYSELDDEYF